ncbi:MAG: anti-sigma regulatory factor [Hymenobacteraceae bacterium]|nr:anti-sigma regulatory factor [Hymenobacteraceae bacterium]
MQTRSSDRVAVRTEPDVIVFRGRLRELAFQVGLSTLEQTKLITAASELVRNMLVHGGGGGVTLEVVAAGARVGIRLTFRDEGPGIADIGRAMQDGFSTAGSLGLGLPGAKRLANEFELRSAPGEGTTVIITSWKNGR